MCVHGLSVVHAFVITWRLVCTFCYLFLASCGVNESLSFHSLCLTSFLGRALLDCGIFLLLSIPYPFCRSVNTSTMSFCYSCRAIICLMLIRPLLGLLYAFLLLNSSSPASSLGWNSSCFGLPWPISSLPSFLGLFHSFRHPRPISFPWASLVYSNSSFPWVFAKFFGLP